MLQTFESLEGIVNFKMQTGILQVSGLLGRPDLIPLS
jgi:hypothetical protein